ncbi:MAG: CheB methylesterase domain-containing protein, partial [Chloroflexota bacterium]|nr:CheB methylesterase domain-containing protein [Chloroflexota bacterium]
MEMNEHNIIVIGSSTGGPKTLKELFFGLPILNASVIVIQHMPHYINESLKEKLGDRTEMQVKLAEDKDTLEAGTVYIARSELHLKLRNNRKIRLVEGDKVNAVCPSIDVTMLSLRNGPGFNLMGVVLTGMGRDGADGISHMKKLG